MFPISCATWVVSSLELAPGYDLRTRLGGWDVNRIIPVLVRHDCVILD